MSQLNKHHGYLIIPVLNKQFQWWISSIPLHFHLLETTVCTHLTWLPNYLQHFSREIVFLFSFLLFLTVFQHQAGLKALFFLAIQLKELIYSFTFKHTIMLMVMEQLLASRGRPKGYRGVWASAQLQILTLIILFFKDNFEKFYRIGRPCKS